MSKPKIGVVLSGCGFLDGAEIHESVAAMLAIDRKGGEMVIMAPDVVQRDVIDHGEGKATSEKRNVMTEAARIARGKVRDIAGVESKELDALIFPGGYGAAKNLCDFAVSGEKMTVLPEVAKLVSSMYTDGKPVGFICIAPVIAAKVLGKEGIKLTIGNDPDTAAAITALGAEHVECAVDGVVVDRKNKIVSTPAYMLGPNIAKVATGIEKLVDEVFSLL